MCHRGAGINLSLHHRPYLTILTKIRAPHRTNSTQHRKGVGRNGKRGMTARMYYSFIHHPFLFFPCHHTELTKTSLPSTPLPLQMSIFRSWLRQCRQERMCFHMNLDLIPFLVVWYVLKKWRVKDKKWEWAWYLKCRELSVNMLGIIIICRSGRDPVVLTRLVGIMRADSD